jgi:hypothetical protein
MKVVLKGLVLWRRCKKQVPMMLVVPNNMTVVQDKWVAHKPMTVYTFEDTVVEGTAFGPHTMFVGTAFGDTVHMLHMVVGCMLAAAAAASADQHMVAHIQSVYTALPVLRPL